MPVARITITIALSTLISLAGCSSDEEVAGVALPDAGTEAAPAPAPEPPPPAPDAAPVEPPDEGGLLACDLEEVSPIFTCAAENCLGLPDFDPNDPGSFDPGSLGAGFDLASIGTCVATNCFQELFGLSPDCSECIFGLIGGGDTALENCLGDIGGLGGGLPGVP